MKKADKYLIIGILIFAALSYCFLKLFVNDSADTVVITRDGQRYEEVFLCENRVIEIKNSKAETTNRLEIKDGYAKMIDSNCPDHLCEQQHKISKNKETIICLPNKVVVEVKAGKHSKGLEENLDIDGVAK